MRSKSLCAQFLVLRNPQVSIQCKQAEGSIFRLFLGSIGVQEHLRLF
jgi:hypothetical protein